MIGLNYVKLQNQGSITTNLRLLAEMLDAADYADSQGYYSKSAVAEIAVNSLIITSGSKIGDAVKGMLSAPGGDQSRNSPLQNAKARMQILRVLGLVSADYGSEQYAITRLGRYMVEKVISPTPDYRLLRELFMGISSVTETYEHNCDSSFDCRLGYGICYALAKMDHRLSTAELPLLTSYDISEIDEFVEVATENRRQGVDFDITHPHYPKRANGQPLRQVSNLTRTINQILRVCDVLQSRMVKFGSRNYYVCTEEGRKFVDGVALRFNEYQFLTASAFRKKNNIYAQKKICSDCHNAILRRSGIDETLPDSTIAFSPYQMLPETCVEWLMGGKLRRHPDSEKERINLLNSQITTCDLKLRAKLLPCDKAMIQQSNPVAERILTALNGGVTTDELTQTLVTSLKDCDKKLFYPFVHSLLNIIGLDCKGEVGRFDAYSLYRGHVIPVEIKSYLETPTYNLKGVRQAIENKIMCFNPQLCNDMNYATLVVGYEHPVADAEIRELVDQAHQQFHINVIVADLASLVKLAILVVSGKNVVGLDSLLTDYGVLTE